MNHKLNNGIKLRCPTHLPLATCGEWPYSFATFVANRKIYLDIAGIKC